MASGKKKTCAKKSPFKLESLCEGLEPVRQKDGHTCGLCAMKAVYRYYGISTRFLRERLGTDHSLPVFSPMRILLESLGFDMKGTWPIDITAVLRMDGLEIETFSDIHEFEARFRETCREGHPALMLQNGWSHWTVACGTIRIGRARALLVADSLRPGLQPALLSELEPGFAGGVIITCVTGDSSDDDAKLRYVEGLKAGLAWLAQMARGWMMRKRKGKETVAGNAINRICGWKDGSALGNWINNLFG